MSEEKVDLAHHDQIIADNDVLREIVERATIQLEKNMQKLAALSGHQPETYRIALRPNDPEADPKNTETDLDDIVVRDVVTFRAEQLDDNLWWVACYLNGATHDRICWNVRYNHDTGQLEWYTTEFPDEPVVYEHE